MGKSYPNVRSVLAMATEQTADQVGTPFLALSSLPDQGDGQDQDYQLLILTTLNAAGVTSPTLDVRIEASMDGTTWFTLVSATQRTVNGNYLERIAFAPPYRFRAKTVVGGAGGTKGHTVNVWLESTGPFELRASPTGP